MENLTLAQFNKAITVKRIKEQNFGNSVAYVKHTGNCLFVEGHGFVSIDGVSETSLFGNKIKYPYTPSGGRKTLLKIIKDGGLTSLEGINFVNPIKVS